MCPEEHTPELSDRIIVVVDVAGFHRSVCRHLSDREILSFLSAYAGLIGPRVRAAGGEVIKYMGDAAVLIFPTSDPAGVVSSLRDLKVDLDTFLTKPGWRASLTVRAHIGRVAVGLVGGVSDIAGSAVNETFLLRGEGMILSTALREKLRP